MAFVGVTSAIQDLSTTIPSFQGITGAMAIPLYRGRTDKPILVTSQSDFLKKTTPNEKVPVGYPSGYYDALNFLQGSNSLLIVNPDHRQTYGMAIVNSYQKAISGDVTGATAYSSTPNIMTMSSSIGSRMKTGSPIIFATDDTLPTGLTAGTIYYAVKLSTTTFSIAVDYVKATATTPTVVSISEAGTGNHTVDVIENLFVADISSEYETSANTFLISETVGKNLQTGQPILVSSGGTIPVGLTNNTVFYVIKISNTQIKLATSEANALLGTSVSITGAGTTTFKLISRTNNDLGLVGDFTIDESENTIVVPEWLGSLFTTGDDFITYTEGSLSGTGITAGSTYYAVKVNNTNLKLATSFANATAGTPTVITLTEAGTGINFITKGEGTLNPDSYSFDTNEIMVIRAKDQGNWSNPYIAGSVQFTIEDYREQEPDSFRINVFKTSDLVNPIEQFVCSRIQSKEDGDGKNIYVEEIMKSSFYLEVIDNIAIDEEVFPICNTTPVSLSGGSDGDPVQDGDMITALQMLANKDEYYLNILMDAGWSTVAFHQAMDTICKARKDCVGIGSIPLAVEQQSDYMTAIKEYRTSTNLNSYLMTLFSSHQKITDTFNNRNIYVSPSGFVGSIISQNATNLEIWYAPAGWKRGTINSIEPLLVFDEGQRSTLDNIGVNPIRSKDRKGIAVWGNKTLLSRQSALNRLTTILMLIQVEPAVAEALDDFTFDFNEEGTRSEITTIIDDYMKGIKAGKGVYDYYVVCDSTNNSDSDIDNHKLTVHLFVKPTKTAEYIKLQIVVTRTGADFNTVLTVI